MRYLSGNSSTGWPQVEVVDAHGVATRGVTVRFTEIGEAVTIEGATGNALNRDTSSRGWAIAQGLVGYKAGSATIEVSLPASPGVAVLIYSVDVVTSGSTEN